MRVNFFTESRHKDRRTKMSAEKAKTAVKALAEQAESKNAAAEVLRGTRQQILDTKKLSREGNKSRLIQIGMALIVLPEPTPVSPTIGACFLAAGAVQKGIKNQSLYMEDVAKTFKNSLKEIISTKYNL